MIKAVRFIWVILGGICSKLLVAALPEMIVKLEQEGELRLDAETHLKLLRMSAATIDRRLAPIRKQMAIKRRCGTRAGDPAQASDSDPDLFAVG